jgi:hypothetical protein
VAIETTLVQTQSSAYGRLYGTLGLLNGQSGTGYFHQVDIAAVRARPIRALPR